MNSVAASGPKLNLPVVASGPLPVAVPVAVAPVVVASGPKSMLNTAKSFLGLGGARRRRTARRVSRRRGRKAPSRRGRTGRRMAGSRRR